MTEPRLLITMVTNCIECSHYEWDAMQWEHICTFKEEIIDKLSEIPDWCPLEKVKK